MQFVNPLFLIALSAVAIPIIVHLFHFRRYKKVYFSNVAALRKMQQETRKQSTLRQLLILAARILAVVFLVLAFAQPFIPNKNAQRQSGDAFISVYIDNSFSMGGTDTDGALLDAAKRKAAEIASAFKPSDNYQLVTNDLSHFRWLNREEFLSAVDEIQLSPASTQLSQVLKRQYDFMHNSGSGSRYAYILSDFQQSTADFENFPTDTTISTTFVPLEASHCDNIYIDSVSLSAPAFFAGSNVVVEVVVRNMGEKDVEGVPISLYANDKQQAIASVDIPAHSSATLPMHLAINHSGMFQCRVETIDYPITFDDQFFFSINVGDRIPMTIIEGRKEENPFLKRLFTDDSALLCKTTKAQNIDFATLSDNHFIVIDELDHLSSGLAQTLSDFVREGGSLLLIASEGIDAETYNQLLSTLNAPTLQQWKAKPQKVADINVANRLYKNVFDGKTDNLELPTVQGHYVLNQQAAVAEPLCTFADGGYMLCATPCERGYCYLCTTPLRDNYTDFVQQALFVPTLYNMVLYSHPVASFYTLIGSGEPTLLTTRTFANEGTRPTLKGDKTDLIPDIRQQGNRALLVEHGEIAHAGNYQLTQEGKILEGLSFNYSRQESAMRFHSAKEVAEQLKNYNISNSEVVKNASSPLDDYIRKRTEGTHLYAYCIVGALLFLLIEILLIRWKKSKWL